MDVDIFLQNQGLHHIAIHFMSLLDFESLLTCQAVSKQWNQFINTNKKLWNQQLKSLQFEVMKNHFELSFENESLTCSIQNQKIELLEKFPNYIVIIKSMERKCIEEIEIFLKHIKKYLRIDWNQMTKHLENEAFYSPRSPWCPMIYAGFIGNENFLNIVLESFFETLHPKEFPTILFQVSESGNTLWAKLILLHTKKSGIALEPELDHDGVNALHKASQNGHFEIVKLLLECGQEPTGIDINAVDQFGWTPLHFACQQDFHQDKDISNFLETIKVLCQHPFIELNVVDMDGATPFLMAASNKNSKVMKTLLAYGGPRLNVNVTDNEGRNALHLAANWDNVDTLEVLLNYSAIDDSAIASIGQTLTHCSLTNNQPYEDVFRESLKTRQNISINAKANDGLTVLLSATIFNRMRIVQKLLDQEEIDVTARTKHTFQQTALHMACGIGYEGIVKLLCKHSSIDVNSRDDLKGTPLHEASMGRSKQHVKIVKVLLEQPNIDVNPTSEANYTPLYLACIHQRTKIVKLLCNQASIDLNIKGDDGETPLHVACRKNNKGIVEMLCHKPTADVNAIDDNGKTPISIAEQRGHSEIVEILKQHQSFEIKEVN